MKKFALPLLAAAAASISAPAYAVADISCDSETNASSCTFGNPTAGDSNPNPFTDLFTFTIAYARSLNGTVGSMISGPSSDVNFGTNGVRIFGPGLTASGLIWNPGVGSGNPELREISNLLLGAGTYTVSVRGSSQANGSYSGALSLGAVPEPATWAFMILGFGLVGGALRRRKAVTNTAVAYA
jgi:PEP-CTERM motif